MSRYCFKHKKIKRFLCSAGVVHAAVWVCPANIVAAEFKAEPALFMKAQYNDNVRMRTEQNNPEASSGYVLEPRIKLSAIEQNDWDFSVDARGKVIRFQDIDDADSENIFFIIDTTQKTELSEWRLNASFETNSSFDTDFNDSTSDTGLFDDRTERDTLTISPSVSWFVNEVSRLQLSYTNIDVSYDEVANSSFQDYEYENLAFSAYWLLAENHQLGFSSAYAQYDSPAVDFSWENIEFSIDYVYKLSQVSDVSVSIGGRRLDSLLENVVVACVTPGEFEALGGCLFSAPIFGDIENEDTGTVTDISYKSRSETLSHSITGGRTVVPSSFGGAEEQRRLNYVLNQKQSERLSFELLLDATEIETLSGVDSTNDRIRYRFEPSVSYNLNRDWSLNLVYRYIEQDMTDRDENSVSNAIFINLFLRWPRLATTY